MYEYDCAKCGPFEAFRPMALYDQPCACETCGASAPRVMLTAPSFAGMDGARRTAFATNERASHAPRKHSGSCTCCKPGTKKKLEATAASAAKSFPSKRPWMISH